MGRGTLPSLAARESPLSSPATQLARLGAVPIDREFPEALAGADQWPLRRSRLEILQINVGKVCNQTCGHCHVDAGPTRTESMSRATAELALRVLAASAIPTVDITGGAPELNENFEYLVRESRRLGRQVIDRCNLTVLLSARSPGPRSGPSISPAVLRSSTRTSAGWWSSCAASGSTSWTGAT